MVFGDGVSTSRLIGGSTFAAGSAVAAVAGVAARTVSAAGVCLGPASSEEVVVAAGAGAVAPPVTAPFVVGGAGVVVASVALSEWLVSVL